MKGKAQSGLLLLRLLPAWSCAPRASQGYLVHFLVYCGSAFPGGGRPKATSGMFCLLLKYMLECPDLTRKRHRELTVEWGGVQDPVETLSCFRL